MSVAVFTSFNAQVDSSGNPLSGGSVTIEVAGTTTLINNFTASDLSGSPASNPITLDSAGRHDMRYIALQAYKIIVKNSSGSTIYTRDNIDPGVVIGTGVLAIANGGTGAASAGAALTALGGATAASVAAIATQVAAVTGALGSTAKTHIATGTTGQRDAVPVEGDIRRNTTTSRWEGYSGSAWEEKVTNNFGALITEDTTPDPANDYLLSYDNSATTNKKVKPSSLATTLNATQAQQETGTATIALVSPAVQQFHPSAAKVWVKWGVTTTIDSSYNMTSITDNGTGDWTLTIATDFSGVDYVAAFGNESINTSNASGLATRQGGQAAGTLRVNAWTNTSAGSFGFPFDPTKNYAVMFGDQ